MSRIVETSHFSNSLARDAEGFAGVRLVNERETSEIIPRRADHYMDQFRVDSDDTNVVAFIDIHHIGNTGLHVVFPTIVRLNEFSGGQTQMDIFSIDDRGIVLVHTKGDGAEITKDSSLERLIPYETEILERVKKYPLIPRTRLEDAFYFYKNPQDR